MTTDAFGVAKAWKGEEGDKRNTKYAGAFLGGSIVGQSAGKRIGARTAGTRLRNVSRAQRAIAVENGVRAASGGSANVGGTLSAMKAVEGASRVRAGGAVGGLLGTTAAVGGYAAYRHGKSGKRRIGASVAGQEARRSAELSHLRANPNKSKIEKKKDRGWGFDSEDARERAAANIRSKAGYTKKGERPGKNWRTLGGHTAVGAGLGAASGAGMAASGGRVPSKVLLAGAGIGAGVGAGMGALSGAATNEYRAGRDAQNEALASGDWRAARKGERASEYHNGVIVPKKKYQKARGKAMEAENASLRQRLAEREANVSYIHKSAFGVDHEYEEVSKISFKPLIGAVKTGFKGGVTPYKPGTAGARAVGAGAGIKSGLNQIKTGATKVGNFAAAHPTGAAVGTIGATAGTAGAAGYGMGKQRRY